MADIDEIAFYPQVESLGYDSAWVADSQMLFSDCYAVLALAARGRPRACAWARGGHLRHADPAGARGGDGHAQPARAGRVHLGMGTGNTAMRSMGHRRCASRTTASTCACSAACSGGTSVDYAFEGARQPIKMLIREKKYMSLEPRIPLYVSAFGPRAMEVGGQYGDGLVIAIPPRGLPPAEAARAGRVGARRDGRELGRGLPRVRADQRRATRARRGGRLRAGDPRGGAERDGERVLLLRYDARARREPPAFLRRIWKRYVALVEETPPEHRHFRTHEGHYTYLHPGEAELIDADLVRDTCLVGSAEELIERIQELERGGLRELMWATGTDDKWRFSRDLRRSGDGARLASHAQLRPLLKISVVLAGYVATFVLASMVVAVRVALTSGPDVQASSGMYAFGDAALWVAVVGTVGLLPTGLALFFLRPVRTFWTLLAGVGLVVAATGAAALILYIVGRAATPPSVLSAAAALTPLRMLPAPLFAVAFLVGGLISPYQAPRWTLWAAAGVEIVVSGYIGIVWFLPIFLSLAG